MNGFLIPTIPPNHNKTDEVIGHNWLSNQVDAALEATDKKQPLHPSTMSPAYGWISHPLISELKQQRRNGKRTLTLDKIEQDISALAATKLPSDLGKRLRDAHDCSKAAYELSIAAGFSRLGYPLVWCPPIDEPHPEFLVTTGTSGLLSVECKKRDVGDGYEKEAGRFWKHLQYPLRKKMQAESLNYWVKVSGREFLLKDIEHLSDEIITAIKAERNGQFDSGTGRYHIEYTWLVEPGGSIPMEVVNMFPRGVYGINVLTQEKGQIMFGPATNPKLLRLEFIDDEGQRIKGLLRNLNDASKQVIKGILNLIYIDVNISDYDKEQAEFENMRQAILGELDIRHRQVSAVVLTNVHPSISVDKSYGWWVRTELIAQPKPTVGLPDTLRFPGDLADSHWLSGNMYVPA